MQKPPILPTSRQQNRKTDRRLPGCYRQADLAGFSVTAGDRTVVMAPARRRPGTGSRDFIIPAPLAQGALPSG